MTQKGIKAPSGSLSPKYFYRSGAKIKTHKSFDEMRGVQERRYRKAMGSSEIKGKEIGKVLLALSSGKASEKEVGEALGKARALGAQLEKAMKSEGYFTQFMGEMSEADRARLSKRIHLLKSHAVGAVWNTKILEGEKKAMRKPK